MRLETRVVLEGPLFSASAIRQFDGAMRGAVKELVQKGEERLAEQLRPRPSGVYLTVAEAGRNASTGNYRRNISTTVNDLNGLITDGGVVYGPWLEGISSRNAASRFKGYATFRRTGDWLREKSRSVFQNNVRTWVKRMNA